MQYTIQRAPTPLGTPDADWHRPQWEAAETLEITHFTWGDSGHHPRTRARALYDDGFLGVIFQVEDHYVRAVAHAFIDGTFGGVGSGSYGDLGALVWGKRRGVMVVDATVCLLNFGLGCT